MMRTTEQHRTHALARFGLFLALMLGFAVGLRPLPALAAGVVGNGTPASCTEAALRNAIAGGGRVTFNCGPNPVTITLSQELRVVKTTEIDGGGKITLSGAGRTRHIYTEYVTLTVRNMTFRDGRSERGGSIRASAKPTLLIYNSQFINNNSAFGIDEESGGAISIRLGTLRVENSRFEGNRGINGGAIHNLLTGATIIGSVFLNNDTSQPLPPEGLSTPFGFGGAVYTDGNSLQNDSIGGTTTIRNSIFIGNKARINGGAVYTYLYTPDTSLIENSHFENNMVYLSRGGKAYGGALHHHNGTLTLRNSTFVGNRSEDAGGAITITQGGSSGAWRTSYLSNLTIANNRSDRLDGTKGLGGGIFVSNGIVEVTNATIVGNYAESYGGGIYSVADNVRLKNSIIANNTVAPRDGTSDQCYKTFSGSSRNLQSTGAGDKRCSSDALIADPRLGTLGAYGGPTRTIALLAGSPAINKGSGCPTTDQRGAPRVAACDLGAFEYGSRAATAASDLPAPAIQSAQDLSGGPLVQISWAEVAGAISYEIQIGPETGLEEELPPKATAETTELVLPLDTGSYLVRVRACDYIGCGAYSETRTVTVTQAPLKIFLPLTTTE